MNFMFYLKYGPMIFGAVLAMAKTIEAEIPDGGLGSQKLALVDNILKAFVEMADDLTVDYEKMKPAIEKMVSAAVTFYKAIGVFK